LPQYLRVFGGLLTERGDRHTFVTDFDKLVIHSTHERLWILTTSVGEAVA